MRERRNHQPRLPRADDATERILGEIEGWHNGGKRVPAFWMHGKPGSGKTMALDSLRRALSERSIAAVLASPPELDFDAPLHLTVQLASELRAYGANGALDVLADPTADDDVKDKALLDELKKLSRGVLLLNVPLSWASPNPDSGDRLTLRARGRALVTNVLTLASQHEMPFVLATRGRFEWPEQVDTWATRIPLQPASEGATLLRDAMAWGSLEAQAQQLDALVGQHAEQMSPLELRIAVALLALSYSASDVRRACHSGIHTLLQLLDEEAARRTRFHAGLTALSRVRFPVAASIVDALLEARLPRESSPLERRVLEDALLLEEQDGFILHPSIRARYERNAADDMPESIAIHASLADALGHEVTGAPLSRARNRAIDGLERLHHAALGLQVEVVRRCAIDSAQLCTLARALSLRGRKREALELYEEVLAQNEHHRYATAYVPFHLDYLGLDPLRAEHLFEKSYLNEPTNPWWARRYVCCLIRRGRLARAREVWLEALGKLSGEYDDEAGEEWLVKNFHIGVAREFLSRGALTHAREVLTQISPKLRHDIAELADAWNRLLHMEESERLGGAVFPSTIPFSKRWEGPHIEALRAQSGRDAWYPGRLLDLGARVTLELADPPRDGAEAQLFRSDMSREDFLACARRSSLELLSEGQFVEVTVSGEDTRIELHPIRRPDYPLGSGFLRNLGAPE